MGYTLSSAANAPSVGYGNGGLASNYSLLAGETVAANVTPAALMLTANPAAGNQGGIIPTLSSSVSGFVAVENLTSLTGNLIWTTTATSASTPLSYRC